MDTETTAPNQTDPAAGAGDPATGATPAEAAGAVASSASGSLAEPAPENGAGTTAEATEVPEFGQADPDAQFSMRLNQDQRDIRDWVHGFAEGVVRPAAAEWDEREETPWPVIQEAAKIGLYGFEALAQFWADPTGLTLALVNEELFWGDGGIGMAIMGSSLAVAGIFANGTPEQMGEWIPQCFGTAEEPKVGAFCVSEPDAGSDVSSLRTRARYDEANDEWVLNGQKAWATNGGIANVHVVVASAPARRPATAPCADWPLAGLGGKERGSLYQVNRGFEFWTTDIGGYRIDPEAGRIEMPACSDQLARDLQDHVKARTAPYKYPRVVDFATNLPRTNSGKIRRSALRGSA